MAGVGPGLDAVIDEFAPRALQRADRTLRERVEGWFGREGVPQFCTPYRPTRESLLLVAGVLLTVGSFGMTVLPFLQVPFWAIVLAPGVLIVLMLPLLRLLAAVYEGPAALGPRGRRLFPLLWRAVYLIGLVVVVLRTPQLRRWEWFDFLVTVQLLLSLPLVLSALRSDRRNELSERRCLRSLGLVYGLVLWAMLVRLHPDTANPSAILALPAVTLLFAAAFGARRALKAASAPWVPAGVRGRVLRAAGRSAMVLAWLAVVLFLLAPFVDGFRGLVLSQALLAALVLILELLMPRVRARRAVRTVLVTALPAVTVLAWVQLVLVPYLPVEGVREVLREVSALVVMLVVAAAVTLFARRQGWADFVHRAPERIGSGVLVALGLLGYPLVVYVFGPGGDPGEAHQLGDARDALIVNLLYGAATWVVAALGVHSVVSWAIQEPRRTLGRSLGYLLQGSALVVVLLIAFGISTEAWQIASAPEISRFLWIIAIFGAVIVGLLLLGAHQEIQACGGFDTREAVRKAAVDAEHQTDPGTGGTHVHDTICQLYDAVDVDQLPLERRLPPVARLNIMMVMLVYQGVRLILVGILMAAFFAVLGYLAVPADVSTAWSIDGLIGARGSVLRLPIYELPWVRTAVLLGAISALYVAIHSVYDERLRAAFFEDIRPAVRRRFAVRLAYLHLIETTAPAEPPAGAAGADQDPRPPAPPTGPGEPSAPVRKSSTAAAASASAAE